MPCPWAWPRHGHAQRGVAPADFSENVRRLVELHQGCLRHRRQEESHSTWRFRQQWRPNCCRNQRIKEVPPWMVYERYVGVRGHRAGEWAASYGRGTQQNGSDTGAFDTTVVPSWHPHHGGRLEGIQQHWSVERRCVPPQRCGSPTKFF